MTSTSPIHSEWNYYYEVSAELLHEKLVPNLDRMCRHASESNSNNSVATDDLLHKAEHLMGRVSRAISRTEGELTNEYESLCKLHGKNSPAVVQACVSAFPHKLISVAELKFKLLQCSTSLKNKTLIPQFGVRKILQRLSEMQKRQQRQQQSHHHHHHKADDVDSDDGESHCDAEEEFFGRCHDAIEAALVELVTSGIHKESIAAFYHVLGANVDEDINLTTFRTLLSETLQVVLGHVDTHGAISSTVSSTASSPTSANKSPAQQQQLNASAAAPADEVHDHHENNQPRKTKPHPPFPVPHDNHSQQQQLTQAAAAAAAVVAPPPAAAAAPATTSIADHLPVYDPSRTPAQHQEVLLKFYVEHVPDFADSVPFLVEQYTGRIGELFDVIREKYGTSTQAKSSPQQQQQQQQQQPPPTQQQKSQEHTQQQHLQQTTTVVPPASAGDGGGNCVVQ